MTCHANVTSSDQSVMHLLSPLTVRSRFTFVGSLLIFFFIVLQTLAVAKKPSYISREQHQVDRELDFPVVPVYPDCCPPWHANLRGQVSYFVYCGLFFAFHAFHSFAFRILRLPSEIVGLT